MQAGGATGSSGPRTYLAGLQRHRSKTSPRAPQVLRRSLPTDLRLWLVVGLRKELCILWFPKSVKVHLHLRANFVNEDDFRRISRFNSFHRGPSRDMFIFRERNYISSVNAELINLKL